VTGADVSGQHVRFSDEEFARRHAAVQQLLQDEELDGLVVFGWSAMGRAVQGDVHHLSGYLGMRDNYVVVRRDTPPTLLVQSYNHVPNAAEVSVLDDVRWGGPNSGATAGELLRHAGVRRVGVVGLMPYQHHAAMAAELGDGGGTRDVTREFRLLRTVKSDEELAWLRLGAAHTDRALAALRDQLRPGLRERELGELVDVAVRSGGGEAVFHYIASTPMDAPRRCVPAQVLSEREIAAGDVVSVEISAAHHGYAGQGLRTYVVGAEPTELFASLHATAERVVDALRDVVVPGATTEDVLAVADTIVADGFTIRDALLHGFGIGLLPPSIGTRATPHANDDWTFAANQTVVVQPNIVTPDERAGVQTGELFVVTDAGLRSLHEFPLELVRV
jgi:Xaa-Pro dipeptidase